MDDLQEIKVMFGDRLELWAEGIKAEAKVESEQKGKQEGEMLIDLKLNLSATFEAVLLDEWKTALQDKWLAENKHY